MILYIHNIQELNYTILLLFCVCVGYSKIYFYFLELALIIFVHIFLGMLCSGPADNLLLRLKLKYI